jgi:O-antigen/teichoic acid export membrane protein
VTEEEAMDEATVVSKALTSSAVVALRGIAIRAVGLGSTLILAGLLSPDDYGVAAVGFSIILFTGFLADGGLGAGLVRRDEPPTVAELRAVLGIQLLLTSTVVACTAVVAALVGGVAVVVAVMVASVLATALQAPGAIVLERRLEYTRRVLVEVCETLTFAGVSVALVVGGAGVWGIALGMVARGLTGSTLMVIVSPVRVLRPSLRLRTVRAVLGFGLKFQGIAALNLLRDQGINALVLGYGGVAALGLWSLAWRILQIPYVIYESLWRVSFPAMSRLRATGHATAAQLGRIMNMVMLVSGPVLVALGAASGDLLATLFGSEWSRGSVVLLPLCVGLLLNGPLSVALAAFLYAQGRTRTMFVASVVHTAAWLTCIVALYPFVGLVAVGLGALLGAVADAIVMNRDARRLVGISCLRLQAWPFLWGTAVMLAGYCLARQFTDSLWELGVGGLASAIVFTLGFAALQPAAIQDSGTTVRRLLRRAASSPDEAKTTRS